MDSSRPSQGEPRSQDGTIGRYGLAWVFVVLALFTAVYVPSLYFDVIEGDDAFMIAHHALGSDPEFQPPYSSWQAMMDRLFAVLPDDEAGLRVAAVGLNAVCAPLLIVLVLLLAVQWLRPFLVLDGKWMAGIAAIVILASPEFLFFGLYYTPSVFGAVIVLSAHLILRRFGTDGPHRRWAWIAACLLFGFGASCRWDLVLYGPVMILDMILSTNGDAFKWGSALRGESRRDLVQRAVVYSALGAAALLSFLLFVLISGVTPGGVLFTGTGVVDKFSGAAPLVKVVAAALPLYSPFFVTCLLVGCLVVARCRPTLLINLLLSAVTFAFIVGPQLLLWPKGVLPLLPLLVTCSIAGFVRLWTLDGKRGTARSAVSPVARWAVRSVLLLMLVLPWLVGIRVHDGSTSWGPGFEIRSYDFERFSGRTVGLTVGPGTAVPSPEGPRPLFGTGFVLLGGEWKEFLVQRRRDREEAIDTALHNGLPILLTTGTNVALVLNLLEAGFRTEHSYWDNPIGSLGFRRTFVHADGRSIDVIRPSDQKPEELRRLMVASGSSRSVLFSFTGTLRSIYDAAPESLQKINVSSALFDVERWPKTAAPASTN